MNSADSLAETPAGSATERRVGTPEREAARTALEEHLAAERLDEAEYEERCAACEVARTESELLRVFADLPLPHPDLRPQNPPAHVADEDVTVLGWTIGIALGFGLPVAVVLGFTYGAWWSLAVPVAVSVVLLYIEHLLTRGRDQEQSVCPPDAGPSGTCPPRDR
ncbi:DUF1707 SHOCT-like domain-containing protein [Catellatospora paridis]|uniref:DUF1707 SHOCT-like domain-containing protein n=1 Tax=Catellatospora paridis TaxID=1617086 RepID=UPI0018AF86D2|nr:DUF1707 domain-containing protein [Catellatospora paridis]